MKRMILACLTAAVLCKAGTLTAREGLKVGGAAPAFRLNDLSGKQFASAQLKGTLTVLDVWAIWCEPCIEGIPMFNRLHAKYAGAGIKVIGIAVQSGSAQDIKVHVSKLGIRYPVLVGTDKTVGDYVEVGFPMTYLISPDGTIAKKYIGVLPETEADKETDLEKEIDRY